MRNLSIKALSWAQSRRNQEGGQTIIEYGLVIAVISIIVIAALFTAVDGGVTSVATSIKTKLP